MMRRATLVLIAVGLLVPAIAAWAQVERFLIVGDSWAEEQWLDESHERVFGATGLNSVGVSGELTTTSGSTAADWVMPDQLLRIGAALALNPHFDTVQLTIGGNDFLGAWNTGYTEAQFDELIGWIIQDIEAVTTYILNQRPDIRIVISLYDYPNFEDTRDSLIWLGLCSDLWGDLGEPTPLQVNSAAIELVDAVDAFVDGRPSIDHVRHLGRAQNFFGLPGSPPGSLPPPGDSSSPSPVEAMRVRSFLGVDCFHFNDDAYDVLIGNLVDGFARDRYAEGLVMSFDTLETFYSGKPQTVPVSMTPPEQATIVSYDGLVDEPVDAGSYSVVVTAPGWRESLSGVFTILPAPQTIDFQVPEQLFNDPVPTVLTASADSGLSVDFALIAGPATLDGDELTPTGAIGSIVVEARQAGNNNWQAAAPIQRVIEVVERDAAVFEDRFEVSP